LYGDETWALPEVVQNVLKCGAGEVWRTDRVKMKKYNKRVKNERNLLDATKGREAN
jgi:hypothetical protein